MSAKPKASHEAARRVLRAFGLAYPGTHLKSPWPDHKDLAVNDKTFAYMSVEGEAFGISCKLPHSSAMALSLPHAEPTGYGLGKSGWVSVSVPNDEDPPVEIFKAWIDESYRAQAPKKLVATIASEVAGQTASPASTADTASKRAAKAKPKLQPAKKAPAKKAPAPRAPAKKPVRKR